jgi:hypothetical protein
MTLHAIMTTAVTHPLQVLCMGIIAFRGVHAAVALVREKWRARCPDSGSDPRRAVVARGATTERDHLPLTDVRRPTAAQSTAARIAM